MHGSRGLNAAFPSFDPQPCLAIYQARRPCRSAVYRRVILRRACNAMRCMAARRSDGTGSPAWVYYAGIPFPIDLPALCLASCQRVPDRACIAWQGLHDAGLRFCRNPLSSSEGILSGTRPWGEVSTPKPYFHTEPIAVPPTETSQSRPPFSIEGRLRVPPTIGISHRCQQTNVAHSQPLNSISSPAERKR
jgi:hypothetical protein